MDRVAQLGEALTEPKIREIAVVEQLRPLARMMLGVLGHGSPCTLVHLGHKYIVPDEPTRSSTCASKITRLPVPCHDRATQTFG